MKKTKLLIVLTLKIALVLSIISMSFAVEDSPSGWAQESVTEAQLRNAIGTRLYSDFQANITRGDFAYLAVRAYEEMTSKKATTGDASFTDTNDPFVLQAKNLGIVNGYEVSKGKFEYRPSNPIRRDELAALMVNLLEAIGADYSKSTGGAEFTDVAKNNWARDSIMIARNNKIVNGTGDGQYAPAGNSTREAAVVMYNNLFKSFNKTEKTDAQRIAELDKKYNVPAGFTLNSPFNHTGIYIPKGTNGLSSRMGAQTWGEDGSVFRLTYDVALTSKAVGNLKDGWTAEQSWTDKDLQLVLQAIKQPALKLTDFKDADLTKYIDYSLKTANKAGFGDLEADGTIMKFLVYDNAVVQLFMEPADQSFNITVYLNSDLEKGTAVTVAALVAENLKLKDILALDRTVDYRNR